MSMQSAKKDSNFMVNMWKIDPLLKSINNILYCKVDQPKSLNMLAQQM